MNRRRKYFYSLAVVLGLGLMGLVDFFAKKASANIQTSNPHPPNSGIQATQQHPKIAAKLTTIQVTLLGQPCLLEGPFAEHILRTVHALGPAQLYPSLFVNEAEDSKAALKKALNQTNSYKNLPDAFDNYRKKVTLRFTSQMTFFTQLAETNLLDSRQDPAPFIEGVKKNIRESDVRQFEGLVKKLKTLLKKSQRQEALDQLFDFYNDSIEADPEAEFHRAIKKLNVQYVCSFDESDEPIKK